MKSTHARGGWVIAATIGCAVLLAVSPMPAWADRLRPDWVALMLLFWAIALPHRVGVGIAWLAGIALDILTGSLVGQHALSLTFMVYAAYKLGPRVRVLPLVQQAAMVFLLVGLNQLLFLWISGMRGHAPGSWMYWLPSVSSMLLWPWVWITLQDLRQRLQVT